VTVPNIAKPSKPIVSGVKPIEKARPIVKEKPFSEPLPK